MTFLPLSYPAAKHSQWSIIALCLGKSHGLHKVVTRSCFVAEAFYSPWSTKTFASPQLHSEQQWTSWGKLVALRYAALNESSSGWQGIFREWVFTSKSGYAELNHQVWGATCPWPNNLLKCPVTVEKKMLWAKQQVSVVLLKEQLHDKFYFLVNWSCFLWIMITA